MGQDEERKPKQLPGLANVVIGGVSGMMAIVFVQPADLIKTRLQVLPPEAKDENFLSIAKRVVRHEGVRGLYTGLTAALLRQATYTAARIGGFNVLTDYYTSSYGTPNFGSKVVLGMMAGALGALVGNPAEIALIRMTADKTLPPGKRRNYCNAVNALVRITKEEGFFSLWLGIRPAVLRAVAVNAAQMGTYTQVREMLLPSLGEGTHLYFCSSMVAAVVSTGISLPVDMIKTRVQLSGTDKNSFRVYLNILRNEGRLVLWSGFLPSFVKLGPHTVITFLIMEQIIALYRKLNPDPP